MDAKESINIDKMDPDIEYLNFIGPYFGRKKGVVIAKVLVPPCRETNNSIFLLFSLWISAGNQMGKVE